MAYRIPMITLVVVVAVVWGLASSPFLQGQQSLDRGGSRIPIDHLPYDIQQPGSYVVTGHLRGTPGEHGIRIWARDVTIDLDGFTLEGVPGSLDAVHVPRPTRLTLRNGTLCRWGGSGVSAPAATVRITDVVVTECTANGIRIGPESRLEACASTNNGQHGLAVGADSTIRDSSSSGNGGVGVVTDRACALRDVQAARNLGAGFVCGRQNTLVHCLARDNAGNGIELDNAASAIACQSFGNVDGFVTGRGSVIRGCFSRRNSGNGALIGHDGTIYDNIFDRNGIAAIHVVGDENHLERNRLVHHAVGLDVDGSKNVVVITFSQENVVDYDLADDTYYQSLHRPGPGRFDGADPWANFDFLEQ